MLASRSAMIAVADDGGAVFYDGAAQSKDLV
jgi:hypothetical protein